MVGCETLANRGVEEYGLLRDIRMTGQICAQLGLHKCFRTEDLVKGGKGFKCRRAGSESPYPATSRQNHAALQAQDRARWQTGKHHPLHPEGCVSNAAVPGV